MPKITKIPIPENAGQLFQYGQLAGSSLALQAAEIINSHPALTLFITADMHQTLRLNQEVASFTQKPLHTLPDWETLPYDSFSPSNDIISSRLSNLYRLPSQKTSTLILPLNTLMQKVCPYSFIHGHAIIMEKGQFLDRSQLRERLEQAGYRSVDQVVEHGEYATRGALFDLFPMGSNLPYRLDLFDNELDSIRTFDIDTQRTISEVNSIHLLPAREFPSDKTAIELFRTQWRETFDIRREAEHIYQQVSKNTFPAGIEYWQPLFFKEPLLTLFDYIPTNTLIVMYGELNKTAERFWHDIEQRYESRRVDPMRPLLPPNRLWMRPNELFQQLKKHPRIQLSSSSLAKKSGSYNFNYSVITDITIQHQLANPLQKLQQFLHNFTGRVIFSVESEGRRETLQNLLSRINVQPHPITSYTNHLEHRYTIWISACEQSFIDETTQTALICERELLEELISSRKARNKSRIINPDTLIRNLTELHEGQPVVHIEHGVGRYAGLTTLETGGILAEYVVIQYAGKDKLYVPVSSLHLIGRYSGGEEAHAPLHKLGGETWSKAQQKASEKIIDVAAKLLDVYANRALKPGFQFIQDDEQYQAFCTSFPYELTFDQERAIHEVFNDMCQPVAMDRLVCGDVGFGKTEVAMRSAFLAIINQKQVALLVPTTLLAQQHFENFQDRFANWPVRIEVLSRFRTAKEQKQILLNVVEGKVDILIGTHKLLQSDLKWNDLGLLIVDEEHRFGVRQKERIKELRNDVDILTLTATPIPRTLNMAMNGIRDLSIIATPPAKRLTIKTFVREYDSPLIREAVLREISRGGQVYYLFNNITKIEQTAEKIRELVPEARVIVGHGQMRERELEKVMNDFAHQRFNVLVCTTIIETGIDIPNANTIVIEQADHFGLAQLHQLRGRVGRSHHQAYAYLITPHPKLMTKDAIKRLKAIVSLEDLGAGFVLATHDLEIRGAGELLGEEQSGQITTLGFSLYMELLENAIEALKEGRTPSLEDLTRRQVEIDLRIPVLLPEEYVPNVNMRLSFYKSIASAQNRNELNELKVDLIDRFGLLPDPASNLLHVAELKLLAKDLGITKIEASDKVGYFEVNERTRIDPHYLIQLLQDPEQFRMDGANKIRFRQALSTNIERLDFVANLLEQFHAHQLPIEL